MARNEEKQWGKLNRLYLEKQKEEYAKAHPKRPRLEHLNTVPEIKAWLPDIKREIDVCLKQAQVPCYSDQKVEEYLDRVEKLKGCYKAFCGKLRRLDTSFDDIPWTERGYKRPLSDTVEEVPLETNEPGKVPFRRIPLPLLDLETKHAPLDSAQPLPELPLQDQPLQFSQKAVSDVCSSKNTLQHKNLRPRSPNPLGLEYSSSSSASEDD